MACQSECVRACVCLREKRKVVVVGKGGWSERERFECEDELLPSATTAPPNVPLASDSNVVSYVPHLNPPS